MIQAENCQYDQHPFNMRKTQNLFQYNIYVISFLNNEKNDKLTLNFKKKYNIYDHSAFYVQYKIFDLCHAEKILYFYFLGSH